MDTRELELILDGKSIKSGWRQTWIITKSLLRFGWSTTKFVAKNTPAALGMAWEVKKDITNAISEEIQNVRKEQKTLDLNIEIKMLKKPDNSIK